MLEWPLAFVSTLDVKKVRRALDEACFRDVSLPPIENHIALSHELRRNLGSKILMKLPVLFCLTHPGLPLMGAFHSSDVDVQAIRLMVLYLLELLNHPSQRSTDNMGVSIMDEIFRGQINAYYQIPPSEIDCKEYKDRQKSSGHAEHSTLRNRPALVG